MTKVQKWTLVCQFAHCEPNISYMKCHENGEKDQYFVHRDARIAFGRYKDLGRYGLLVSYISPMNGIKQNG